MTTQVRASHILVKTEDEANRILKRINDGEDFLAVAKRFSSCPSRKNGGDLVVRYGKLRERRFTSLSLSNK
jgi:peptidyl-prolyl cis-trans isomerase C